VVLNSPKKKLAQVDGSDIDNDCVGSFGALDNGVRAMTGNHYHLAAIRLDAADFGHIKEMFGRLVRKAECYSPMILADLIERKIDGEPAPIDDANPVRNALDFGDLMGREEDGCSVSRQARQCLQQLFD